MDSPVLNQLFRQLFRHPACQAFPARSSRVSGRLAGGAPQQHQQHQQQCRSFLTRRAPSKRKNSEDALTWNRRGDYPKDIDEELRTYPLVTARDLRRRKDRPRQVKMLTREFIDGRERNGYVEVPKGLVANRGLVCRQSV